MVGTVEPHRGQCDIPVTTTPVEDPQHNVHKIKSAVLDINGKETTILLQPFSDRIFVLVTQMNKMGTIVSFRVTYFFLLLMHILSYVFSDWSLSSFVNLLR